MASRKIDNISFDMLITKYGFPTSLDELRVTYKFDSEQDLRERFERRLLSSSRSALEIKNLIVKYEELFNKEMYAFRMAKLIEEDLEDDKKAKFLNLQRNAKVMMLNKKPSARVEAIKELKEILKDIDVVDVRMSLASKEVFIESSQEYIGSTKVLDKKKEKNEAQLKKIEEVVPLSEIIKYLRPTDLIEICRYPNLGNTLGISIQKNDLMSQGQVEINDKLKGQKRSITEKDLQKGIIFDWGDFEDIIRNYIEYMDLDKMLLLSNAVFYNKYGDEFYRFSKQEAEELEKYTQMISSLTEKTNPIVISPRFRTAIDLKMIKESVKALNNHFINGYYKSDLEISQMINDVITGRISIRQVDINDLKRVVTFTANEIISIVVNNDENFEYLVKEGIITGKNIEKVLSGQVKIEKAELAFLIKENIIDEINLNDFYMQGKVSLDTIETFIKENPDNSEFIEKLTNSDILVSLLQDESKKEEYEKYKKLYKLIHITGKSLEERKEIAESILEKSEDLLDNEKLLDLYHQGLIPVDTLVEYVGGPAVENLYGQNELKPVEANRLFKDGIISLDMIKRVLEKKKLDDTEKLVLIYSTFPDKEEYEIRDELIQFLDEVVKSNAKAKSKPATLKIKQSEEDGSKVKKNRFVTDPCLRWQLIASLDPDYSQRYLKDGHIIFYMPNKEKYVIEKLYDSNRRPAYSSATYILDEELFKKYESRIVEENKIVKPVLTMLRQDPEVKKVNSLQKIIHTGWGKGIQKAFEVNQDEKYSKEDLDNIIRLTKEIEESKQRLDDRE